MKKILVIVDMQKDFTTGVLGNAECAAAIPEVVKVVAEGNFDEIVLTKDTHDQTYLHTQEGKYLPVEHCIEGTEGWEIVDEIQAACQSCKNLHMVCKPTFGSLELGYLLKTLCEKYKGEETEIAWLLRNTAFFKRNVRNIWKKQLHLIHMKNNFLM